MNKPKGWNAQRQNGQWFHEFEGNISDALQYNWAIVDNGTVDDEDPLVWLPFSLMPDGLSSIKGEGGIMECLSLYYSDGCCDGHEWIPALEMMGTVYGHCQNDQCPRGTDSMYRGVSRFHVSTIGDWVDFVGSDTIAP